MRNTSIRRSLIGRVLAGVILVTTSVAISGSPAEALAGGRVTLRTSPIRIFDSRESAPKTSFWLGSGVLQVNVLPADTAQATGTAVIHPCASPPPTDRYTFRLEESSSYARIVTGEDACLTATDPVHVIIDVLGDVSASPTAVGSQYIPLSDPATLFDGNAVTDQVVRIPRPAALSATATAAVIGVEAYDTAGLGWLIAYDCSAPRPFASDVRFARTRRANIVTPQLGVGSDLCIYLGFSGAHLRVTLLGELNTDGPNPSLLPPSWQYVAAEVAPPSIRPITPVRMIDTRIGTGRAGTQPVAPGDVVELAFPNQVGATTAAVALNVTAVAPQAAGHITVWPCGQAKPSSSNLNYAPNQTIPNLVISGLSPSKTICMDTFSATHLVADLTATFETDGGLQSVPIDPQRILDTREAVGVTTTTRIPAQTTVELQVTGTAGVSVGAGAATLNVTVAAPAAAGHVTVWSCDATRPETSNLNYAPGETAANLVTSKLSAAGKVCLWSYAETHLIADTAAWYAPEHPDGLIEISPERILDTRYGIGAPQAPVEAGTFIRLQVTGPGIPASANAVVMNVTVTAPQGAGHVTAWPCDGSMPVVSNLNYVAGQTRPNLATVKLAADGSVCLYSFATAHLIADVSGYLDDTPVQGVDLRLTP